MEATIYEAYFVVGFIISAGILLRDILFDREMMQELAALPGPPGVLYFATFLSIILNLLFWPVVVVGFIRGD